MGQLFIMGKHWISYSGQLIKNVLMGKNYEFKISYEC